MNNEKARFVWVPLLIAVAIAGGILIGRFFSADTSFGKTARYDKIESLLQCIEQQYVDTVNRNDLIENVVPKVIGELDPHSAYIPAKDLESVNRDTIQYTERHHQRCQRHFRRPLRKSRNTGRRPHHLGQRFCFRW